MTTAKNYLVIAGTIALLIIALSAWKYVGFYGQSIQPSSFRSFTVSGEGKVIAVPDVATFSFSIITQGKKDIAALQTENSDQSNKAIAFLKEQGIDPKDIKTANYNLEPRYQYFNCPTPKDGEAQVCPPPEIVGYTISQSVAVKVRDFKKIGDIFGGVITAGANSVSELQFTIDEPEKLQNEAREKAIKQAKEKAQALAQAGDFDVGRLLDISEGYVPPFYRSFGAKGSDFGGELTTAVSPTIEAGSQEVKVNVSLRYEIK